MVIAYHVILEFYGFWLPNDERGSWSNFVWAEHLRRFGPATKADVRRSLAAAPHDPARRAAAKAALKYPAVQINGRQARAVANGFADISRKLGYTAHACAILPDHVHLVIARHEMLIEDIAEFLKRAGTRQLRREGLHPFERYRDARGRAPSPWAVDGWYGYLNAPADIERSIHYTDDNPAKDGLRRQRWRFVTRYGGGSRQGSRGREAKPGKESHPRGRVFTMKSYARHPQTHQRLRLGAVSTDPPAAADGAVSDGHAAGASVLDAGVCAVAGADPAA